MTALNTGILSGSFLETALPKISGITHDVRLVAHTDFRPAIPPGMIESVIDDPADAFTRVNLDLGRDLFGSSLFKRAARVDVGAFGILPDDGEVYIFRTHSLYRAQPFVEQLHRTDVGIQVQAKPHSEQDLGCVALIGNSRVTHCAKKNRVEIFAEHVQGARRQ